MSKTFWNKEMIPVSILTVTLMMKERMVVPSRKISHLKKWLQHILEMLYRVLQAN
jgi:hypothetical protein